MPDRPLTDPVRGESEPDRFWTVTNVGEATPDVLSPLCWDIWSDGLERAWLQSMFDFGLLARSETALNADPNARSTAAIYGRQAVNVEVIRRVVGRLPGVNPSDVERDLLGSVRSALPPEHGARLRVPIIAAKLPWVMLGTHRRVQRMHDSNRRWWRAEVAAAVSSPAPLTRLQTAAERFAEAMNLHSRVRFLIPVAERAVTTIARRSGADDVASLAGGLGDIEETALADCLWRVSSGELSLRDFLDEYGFHGPNEGNVYTRSWRERPERVEALLDSYRVRADMTPPRDLERATMRARDAARRRALDAVAPPLRQALAFALRRLGNLTRNLELTKASFLRALDGARAAARDLGAELCARGTIGDVDDAFFLTIDEHRRAASGEFADDPGYVKRLVTYRREQRERYANCRLPITFVGMPELRPTTEPATAAVASTEIRGVAGGFGVVEGRARVVVDPNDDVDLEPGDVLVCRCTDPSWAPLFVCASALVIDIGAASSHGAVVARELGIPYVIGTGDATLVIREGARIRVDGPRQQVSILTPV
jgi:pyruvate,water dikinase